MLFIKQLLDMSLCIKFVCIDMSTAMSLYCVCAWRQYDMWNTCWVDVFAYISVDCVGTRIIVWYSFTRFREKMRWQALKNRLGYWSGGSGLTMGPQGPQLQGAQARRGPKGPISKPYSARWGIGGPFLRSCGGLKFEVTPLSEGVRNFESVVRDTLSSIEWNHSAVLCQCQLKLLSL